MFVGTQQQKEQKEMNTREHKGQDASKIMSCSRRVMHPMSLVSCADDSADVDGEKHSFPNQPSRISQRRSMTQDVSDSTISFTY